MVLLSEDEAVDLLKQTVSGWEHWMPHDVVQLSGGETPTYVLVARVTPESGLGMRDHVAVVVWRARTLLLPDVLYPEDGERLEKLVATLKWAHGCLNDQAYHEELARKEG